MTDFAEGSVPATAIRNHNELIRQIANEEHLTLVDLERLFEDVPEKAAYFFRDKYHAKPLAAAYIGKQIADALAQEL